MKQTFLVLAISLISFKLFAQSWAELSPTQPLGGDTSNIFDIVTDKNKNLYAIGNFKNNIGFSYVAKWNGTTWSELGGLNSLHSNTSISAITVDDSDNVFVDYTNYAGLNFIAKWNGTAWIDSFKTGIDFFSVIKIKMSNVAQRLYVADFFHCYYFNGHNRSSIYFDNSYFNVADTLINFYSLKDITVDRFGILYACGDYYKQGHTYVLFCNPNIDNLFRELVPQTDSIFFCPCPADVIATDTNGLLFCGGDFHGSLALANYEHFIADWDRTNWSVYAHPSIFTFDSILNSPVSDIKFDSHNNMYVIGYSKCVLNGLYCLAFPIILIHKNNDWSDIVIDSATLANYGGPVKITVNSKNDIVLLTKDYLNHGKIIKYDTTKLSSGVASVNNNELLKVYPNPASQTLTLKNEKTIIKKIEIENILGQVVLNENEEAQETFNNRNSIINIQIGVLPTGIYFLKATDEKGFVHTAKFVKE